MTTITLAPTPVTDAGNGPSPTAWDVPFGQFIPAGSGLIFILSAGGAQTNITSLADDLGNAWRVAARAPGGRTTMIGVCERTVRELRPTDVLHLTGNQQLNASRLSLFALPPFTVRGAPVLLDSDQTPGQAVALPAVPAHAGEFIFAGHTVQGTYTFTAQSWPTFRQHPQQSPTLRAFWLEASGPATFTGTLSASGGWSMAALRLAIEGITPPEPPPPPPPPVPVRVAGLNAASGADSYSAATTQDVPAGALLLVGFTATSQPAPVDEQPADITDDQANAYVLLGNAPGSATGQWVFACRVETALPQGSQITATKGNTLGNINLAVLMLPEAAGELLPGMTVAAGNDTAPFADTGPVPADRVPAVALAFLTNGVSPPAWTAPMAQVSTLSGNGAGYLTAAYAQVLDPAGLGAAATLPSALAWGMAVVTVAPPPPPPPPEPPPELPELVPVTWDGVELNPGYRDDGLLCVVTDVEGWFGTPPLEGGDLDRALADGAVWGPKTVKARGVHITGAVTGPRALCLQYARQLAGLATAKDPAPLVIWEDGHILSADVRAGSDQLSVVWSGPVLFRYEVTVTAADPRLFEDHWDSAVLETGAGIDTGRHYPKTYPWQYGAPDLPNSARLPNDGNTPAPVWATFTGPLAESRLTNGLQTIRVAAIPAGVVITIACETLAAWAPGGSSRAAYVLPGSQPMVLPPYSADTWALYAATGDGDVLLRWREAWS